MKLADRVAIVTGSSSGIGRGVALAFAAEGAAVVVNHRSEAEQLVDTAATSFSGAPTRSAQPLSE